MCPAMFVFPVPAPESAPLVSVLMVARNAGDFIHSALLSARVQTFREIEIVVVDDGSTDETRKIAALHAASDPRIRIVSGPRQGLAAVRNTSLAVARAPRVILLDSDDILHPRHVELLHQAALKSGAQIVASNMIAFTRGEKCTATLFARGKEWQQERWINRTDFVRSGRLNSKEVSLGYLKPMIELEFLRASGIEYDPALRIGEDYDLVARAMAAGATYFFSPAPTYFYRRHAASTSYRLSRTDLISLLVACKSDADCDDGELSKAAAMRRRSLEIALAHLDAIEALKNRQLHKALAHLVRCSPAAGLLLRSMIEGLLRRLRSLTSVVLPAYRDSSRPAALLIGDAPERSATARVARLLSRHGYKIVRLTVNGSQEPLRLAAIPRADIFLLPHEDACEVAPFVIAPEGVWIAEAGVCHPRIDLHVATAPGEGALDITESCGAALLAEVEARRPAKLKEAIS